MKNFSYDKVYKRNNFLGIFSMSYNSSLFLYLFAIGLVHICSGEREFKSTIYGVYPGFLESIHASGSTRPGEATETNSCDTVTSVPTELRSATHMWPEGLSKFYKKYTEAYGIPIIGSSKVQSKTMKRACYVVKLLFADRYDIRNSFYHLYGRFALIADEENLTDLPEYSHMSNIWNTRARGLGSQIHNPISSAGDDNIRCSGKDRYRLEDIMLHELSHGVHLLGASYVIPGFERRLRNCYDKALKKEIWKNHYAATNVLEYWAVGATYYYNTEGPYTVETMTGKKSKKVTDTGQNILAKFDPDLLALLREVYPCNNTAVQRCAYKECSFDQFNHIRKKADNQAIDNCPNVCSWRTTLEDCARRTCHWDGNTFMYRDGQCVIKLCEEKRFRFANVTSGHDIYMRKKKYWKEKRPMTLTEETNQVLRTNCVSGSKPKNCPKENRIQCGPVGIKKKSCVKKYGCCWSNNKCFYATQDCMDKQIDCRDAGDTCTSNKYFMLRHCPFTCGVCQYLKKSDQTEMQYFCQDHNIACRQWTVTGECMRNPDFMKHNCPQSCKFCIGQPRCELGKRNSIKCPAESKDHCAMKGCCWESGICFYPSDCKDMHKTCPYAAFLGECNRNPNTMLKQCPVSCNSCDLFDPKSQFALSPLRNNNGCSDKEIVNCPSWAKINECENNSAWMKDNCALSCKHCTLEI